MMDIRNEEQLGATHVYEQILGIAEALVAFPPVSSTATAAAPAINRTSAPAPVVVAASPAIVIAPVPPWRRPAPIVAAFPCGSSHIHARSGRVSSFGDAEVNSDLSSIQFDPIQSLPSFTGVVKRLEVDEGKTSAATTVPVQHNLTLLEGAELAELLLQLALGGVETEAEHTKALRLVRVLPIAIMAPAVGHWRTGVVSCSTPAIPGSRS